MKRLVFVTQAYDPGSTILGVTRDWVAALAERCAGVDVIAVSAPPGASTAANVRVASLGKDRGAGKLGQLAAFYGALARALPGAGAVLVHMVPRYAVLAWPLTAAARRPLALWYAQGGVDRWLKLASRAAGRILTPTRDSFPLAGTAIDRKVVVTGHGIDTCRYTPDGSAPVARRRLLAAGRLSPSKRYEVLLAAASRLRDRVGGRAQDRAWHLRIAGGPLYESDHAYAARLRAQVTELQLTEQVEFAGFVPYDQMPAEYRAAWAFAHTSATGSLDKVVLEAMACGTPAVSTAPSSREALGPLAETLWCGRTDPASVAERLGTVLAWTAGQRAEAGAAGRELVEQHHSLPRWADQVVDLLGVR